MSLVKGIVEGLLHIRPVGVVASHLTHTLAAPSLHRRIARMSGYVPGVVTFRVTDARGHLRTGRMASGEHERDHVARAVWLRGWAGYEPPMPVLWSQAAMPAAVVLDVGANSGFYSILAGLSGGATVHAFEPFGPAMARLRQNVSLSHLTDRIVCVTQAVGREAGVARLYVPRPGGDVLETSASLNADFRDEHKEVVEVALTTLDDYVDRMALPTVDLMKIDVESREHDVLAGAQHVIGSHRPLIFLEVLASGHEEIEANRRRHEYRCLEMREDSLVLQDRVCGRENRDQILCPSERLQAVQELAARSGLDFIR